MRVRASSENITIAGMTDSSLCFVFLSLILVSVSFGSIVSAWSSPAGTASLILLGLMSIVSWPYYTYFEKRNDQTLGKRAMQIKTVFKNDSRCSLVQIVLRNVLQTRFFHKLPTCRD